MANMYKNKNDVYQRFRSFGLYNIQGKAKQMIKAIAIQRKMAGLLFPWVG